MLPKSSNNLAIVASGAGCSAYLQVGAIVIFLAELGVNIPLKSIIATAEDGAQASATI